MAVTRAPLTIKQAGTGRRSEVEISGTITLTAAGAIASVSCEFAPNITGSAGTPGTILKDAAAGRYNITFLRKFKNIRPSSPPGMTNASATVALGNTHAHKAQWRPSATAIAGQTITIQGILASTGADTDFVTGTVLDFSLVGQLT
jgi:hypothetical protein